MKISLILLVVLYVGWLEAKGELDDGTLKKHRNAAMDEEDKRIKREEELASMLIESGETALRGSEKNNRCSNRDTCDNIIRISKLNLRTRESLLGERRIALDSEEVAPECYILATTCDPSTEQYRRANGQCNNINQPFWGKTFTPFQRILPAEYNGIGGIQTGKNPRKISVQYVTDADLPTADLSTWVMQFGQFLDHDITHTPNSQISGYNGGKDCCNEKVNSAFEDCEPIPIMDDPVLSITCMNFIRSLPISPLVGDGCTLGAREQMNQITAFIDASNVYGSDDDRMDALRGINGLLEDSTINFWKYLPMNSSEQCGTVDCFIAGDLRVNEQPGLTVLHTLFMREHNHIATKIKAEFDSWPNDKIFFETRKIVAAIMQNIVYSEYLPIILGQLYVDDEGLSLDNPTTYNPGLNPTIFNEFSTAAYRFGHTTVPTELSRSDQSTLDLKDTFDTNDYLHEPFNPVMKFSQGLLDDFSMEVDRHFVEDIHHHLFENTGPPFDLISLNIQRGRDHGLPSYKKYKEHYNGPGTVSNDIEPTLYSALLSAYGGDEDAIELFLGGVSEKHAPGAAVGPLFQRIIGDQYYRLKFGDRFFFNNGLHYTDVAVTEIRKVKLSHILCRHSGVPKVAENVFVKPFTSSITCKEDIPIQNGVDVTLTGFFQQKIKGNVIQAQR